MISKGGFLGNLDNDFQISFYCLPRFLNLRKFGYNNFAHWCTAFVILTSSAVKILSSMLIITRQVVFILWTKILSGFRRNDIKSRSHMILNRGFQALIKLNISYYIIQFYPDEKKCLNFHETYPTIIFTQFY